MNEENFHPPLQAENAGGQEEAAKMEVSVDSHYDIENQDNSANRLDQRLLAW